MRVVLALALVLGLGGCFATVHPAGVSVGVGAPVYYRSRPIYRDRIYARRAYRRYW